MCVIALGSAAAPTIGADCNGNGVPDQDEIDGVPDECAIVDLPWLDCDGDGMIDRCVATYRGDDGTAEFGFGSTNSTPLSFLWAKGFVIQPGLEAIGAVEICWRGWKLQPDVLPGASFTVGLLSDPNGDGAPNDAAVLVAVDAIVADTEVGEFQVIPVPATLVGQTGQWFFVAVYITVPPTTYPICVDEDPPLDVSSWRKLFVAGQGGIDQVALLTKLPASIDGDYLLHAVGVDAGALGPADLDCNGSVGGSDLGLLLGSWGGFAGDLNGDGTTDGADLGILLGAWTG